jgi:hypothetical protein
MACREDAKVEAKKRMRGAPNEFVGGSDKRANQSIRCKQTSADTSRDEHARRNVWIDVFCHQFQSDQL